MSNDLPVTGLVKSYEVGGGRGDQVIGHVHRRFSSVLNSGNALRLPPHLAPHLHSSQRSRRDRRNLRHNILQKGKLRRQDDGEFSQGRDIQPGHR